MSKGELKEERGVQQLKTMSRSSNVSRPWTSGRPKSCAVCGSPRRKARAGGCKRSPRTTMVGSSSDLANHLVELGIERVVMEATSDYWRPPFYLFEAHGLQPWLFSPTPKTFGTCPGVRRPTSWTRCGCARSPSEQTLRPSSVPPAHIRSGRGARPVTGGRGWAPTATKNRVEKLLEEACIKLSVVISDIHGVSGRAMMDAMITGERDPKVLADMAKSRNAAQDQTPRGRVRRSEGRDLRHSTPVPTSVDA